MCVCVQRVGVLHPSGGAGAVRRLLYYSSTVRFNDNIKSCLLFAPRSGGCTLATPRVPLDGRLSTITVTVPNKSQPSRSEVDTTQS
jgi:hypothetical protein